MNANDEPVELHGCLERMCGIEVTHPAGASARRIYSLRGHLADILYSWSNNAFRLSESFHRKLSALEFAAKYYITKPG